MSSRMHGSEEALAAFGCRDARAARRAVRAGRRTRHGLHAARDARLSCRRRRRRRRRAGAGGGRVEPRSARSARRTSAEGPARPRSRSATSPTRCAPSRGRFDAVLLDVDNGPAAFTAAHNTGLYDDRGLAAARAALQSRRRAGGVVGVGRSQVRAAAALRRLHRPGRARPRPPEERRPAPHDLPRSPIIEGSCSRSSSGWCC